MTTTTMHASAATIQILGQRVPVKTLDEARAVWIGVRDSEGLGASDYKRGDGAYRESGVKIAHISYNGRMWTPEPYPACKEIL